MFYRRKILLALLQVFDNALEKIALQKLLFLVCNEQDIPSYEFVPYKYGCFSFQSYSDIRTLIKYHQIGEENKNNNLFGEYWIKRDKHDYVKELKENDRILLLNVRDLYKNHSITDLINITYKNYPYFAINSLIKEQYLNQKEIVSLERYTPNLSDIRLFTIGYEGKTLEKYLNQLIQNSVYLLCDVRKNPISRKNGFSKTQLKNACENLGIKYLHFPEYGIISGKRKYLNTNEDYSILFDEYNTSSDSRKHLETLLNLLTSELRIALTCFEADINKCHRKHLADLVSKYYQGGIQIQHL